MGLKLHFGVAVVPSSSLWVCKRRSWICNRVLMGKSFCSGLQAACLLAAFCFQSSRRSFLITAVVRCRSLFMLRLFLVSNTLIINVGCQKAVRPFCTSQCKATEEKSSLLSLDHTILSTTISRLYLKKIITLDSLSCSTINLVMCGKGVVCY